MTISIWIILAVIFAFGFWFYFKKKKHLIQDSKNPITDAKEQSEKKYILSDIDKMLGNITEKDTVLEDDKKGAENQKDTEEKPEKVQKNKAFSAKSGIIESIILERKKKR